MNLADHRLYDLDWYSKPLHRTVYMSNGREEYIMHACKLMQAYTAVTIVPVRQHLRTAAYVLVYYAYKIYVQRATIVKNSEIHGLAK